MTDTTTRGFPYPEGTDLVINGDNAIEALAQALDDYHAAFALTAVSNQSMPNGGPTYVEWTPGSSNMSSHFELSGDNKHVYYNGPGRWVHVSLRAVWGGSAGTDIRALQLQANGGLSNGTDVDLIDSAVLLTHRLDYLLLLDDGGYIDVTASQSSGSAKDLTVNMRVVAL